MIPHGTKHPHGTQDIPHGTEHSSRHSRYPPTVLMISSMVLNISHGTDHPHSTAHTLYRVKIQLMKQFFEDWTETLPLILGPTIYDSGIILVNSI